MTAREQLIDRTARAMHQAGLDTGTEYADWAQLLPSVRDSYRADARAAVDAILPLVTTHAELKALPFSAALMVEGRHGRPAFFYHGGNGRIVGYSGDDYPADRVLAKLPVVVWQPSDGAA